MIPDKKYRELFPDAESKAKAFDKLAECYYFCNFGSMSKADLDLLMFSEYLDRILERSESNLNSYSDYTLSKQLGITQSRISSLKEKKQLKYPYEKFVWEESFLRVCDNARYENGRIKIHIPDRNLYLEIKNAVESMGGYVDVQLNSTLLQISPEYFVNLLMVIQNESDRDKFRKNLRKKLKTKSDDVDFFDSKETATVLKENFMEFGVQAVFDIVSECLPGGKIAFKILDSVIKTAFKN